MKLPQENLQAVYRDGSVDRYRAIMPSGIEPTLVDLNLVKDKMIIDGAGDPCRHCDWLRNALARSACRQRCNQQRRVM